PYRAEPLLAGIHAGDVDRLSIKALFPRLVEAEKQHGSLLRAFRIDSQQSIRRQQSAISHQQSISNQQSISHQHSAIRNVGDGAFKSLPGGLSEMIDALAKALPAGSIRTEKIVQGLRVEGSGLEIETSGGEAFRTRAVVVATPAYMTSTLTREIDAELSRLCGEIPYASSAAVVLAFRRDAVAHPLNGSGFVVPRVERSGILAASWLSSKWPHRAPPDRILVRTFVGGARDPAVLAETDAQLVDRSLRALTPLLGIRGSPLFTRVYRFPRSNAQHEVGHLARVEAIGRALARHPGLFVTGSGFRVTGIPDCIADGRATARAAADFSRQTC